MSNITLKSLKEQVISLNVELSDKKHLCELLERKIEQERSLLGKEESEINEENKYQFDVRPYDQCTLY
jgi:hypothetical protein